MSRLRRDYDTYLILAPEIESRKITFLNFIGLDCQYVKIVDKKAEICNVQFKQKGGLVNVHA
jgi:hypothetical protein